MSRMAVATSTVATMIVLMFSTEPLLVVAAVVIGFVWVMTSERGLSVFADAAFVAMFGLVVAGTIYHSPKVLCILSAAAVIAGWSIDHFDEALRAAPAPTDGQLRAFRRAHGQVLTIVVGSSAVAAAAATSVRIRLTWLEAAMLSAVVVLLIFSLKKAIGRDSKVASRT
jgi:hypothetical protein